MTVSPGGSAYWQGLTFFNAREPVVAATLNGQDLEWSTASDGSVKWVLHDGGPLDISPPLLLELLGASGAVLNTTLDRLETQPLVGVQFPLQEEASPASAPAEPEPVPAPLEPVPASSAAEPDVLEPLPEPATLPAAASVN